MKHIMKHTKRFVAFLLAAVMVLALGSVTAFAEDAKYAGDSELVIHGPSGGRDYDLYQIFYGDYGTTTTTTGNTTTTNRSLSNLQWGVSMTTDNVTALRNKLEGLADGSTTLSTGMDIPTALKSAFSSVTSSTGLTADEVAAALKTLESDSEAMNAFATILSDILASTTPANGTTDPTYAKTSQGRHDYTFDNIHDGYYLVEDTTSSIAAGSTRSRTMIQVVGPTTMTSKDVSGPVIDKTAEDEKLKEAAVEIGATVPFKLTSIVPDMGGYNKYYFIVTDKMGKGLTFDTSSVVVKIDADNSTDDGTVTLTNSDSAAAGDTTTYTLDSKVVTANDLTENSKTTGTYKYASLTTDDIGKTIITIVFNDMKQYQDKYQGEDIVITYNATVNTDFEAGNVSVVNNKAFVTYPNDPNTKYDGENEPTDDEKKNGTVSTGAETGENNTVKLYTTNIVVNKTDADGVRLTGAKFNITGSGSGVAQTTVQNFNRVFDYTGTTAPTGGYWYKQVSGIYEQIANTTTSPPYVWTYVYQLSGTLGESGWSMTQVSEDTQSSNLYYMKSSADTSNLKETDVVLVSTYNSYSSDEKTTFGELMKGYAAYTRGDDTDTTYKLSEASATAEVGANGQITFSNVGESTYTIKETDSPNGYELISGNYTVKVTFTAPTSSTSSAIWTYEVTDPENNTSTINSSTKAATGNTGLEKRLSIGSNGELILQIVNESGAALPTTGGIGTTIFYIVGAILVLGAVVVLVTRRRMRGEQ